MQLIFPTPTALNHSARRCCGRSSYAGLALRRVINSDRVGSIANILPIVGYWSDEAGRGSARNPMFPAFLHPNQNADITTEKMWLMTRVQARAPGGFQLRPIRLGRMKLRQAFTFTALMGIMRLPAEKHLFRRRVNCGQRKAKPWEINPRKRTKRNPARNRSKPKLRPPRRARSCPPSRPPAKKSNGPHCHLS
jgi:hypothetical protein